MSEKGYVESIDNPDGIKIKSKIMIPLMDETKLVGIATAYSTVKQIKNFSLEDLEVFNAVTPQIVNAIYKIETLSSSDKSEKSDEVHYNRRSTDTLENLESIKQERENTQTPQEVLDFVSNIVHDIRTPSNGLFGFLEILEEQIQDERLKKYILHAKESASLISELTTSILDSVSMKREVSKSKIEIVSPFKFFGDIAEIFSATMFQKQISYNVFIDPALPSEIKIESIKLKRIIMNLIGNANKFTNENETIEFSVRYKAKDRKIHILVKDSGIGIAQDKQKQIFEAFKQAEDNTSLEYGGTGLGLAISAGYVKELGGKLLVDSKLDEGSTFHFDIPLEIVNDKIRFEPLNNNEVNIAILMDTKNSFVANNIGRYLVKMGLNVDKIKPVKTLEMLDESVTHLIAFENKISGDTFKLLKSKKIKMLAVEENFLSIDSNNLDEALLISQYGYFADTLYRFIDPKETPRVLIVDDDKLSVALVETILSQEFCIIDIAYDGQEGLDMITQSINAKKPYNIVYLDGNMPRLSGDDMLKGCRDLESKKGVKKVFAVSISGDVNRANGDLINFNVALGKPFNRQEIRDVFYKSIK
ncbi:MAG: hybrid sensor histidine kinase/response regulator [Campylobacterota bacterium]|nr:hybrid sensor histidine kinase/response regulator [Campylobacterota bacterium]